MNKKILIAGVIALAVLASSMAIISEVDDGSVSAEIANTDVASIGDVGYTTLESAVEAIQNGTIKLEKDVTCESTISLNGGKTITIDLNGHTISAASRVFDVQNCNLTLTGNGTIQETQNDGYAPLCLKGSNNPEDTNYTVITVGEGVTLKGWSGLMISPYESGSQKVAYGVVVNIFGDIVSPAQESHTAYGSGVYVNGQIQHKENCPVITLNSTVSINAKLGIYAAGYADWNIEGASITGYDSGIAVKAGKFIINDATISCTGPDTSPTTGYSNGVNASGAAIQMESNNGYAGDIEIEISGSSTINSTNGYALYEYLNETGSNPATVTKVTDLSIEGGTFTYGEKGFALFSDNLAESDVGKNFITGGTFDDICCVDFLSDNASISIGKDVTCASTISLNGGKTITIDLNGHTISAASRVFDVQNCNLTLTGNGTIQETQNDGYAPLCLKGSNNSADTNYTVITVGEGVTLKGWSGLMISPYESGSQKVAYGVVVNIFGDIVSPAQESHTAYGSGVYVNGQIQHKENCPVITLNSTVSINAKLGIYAAGYADWNIEGASITGYDSGIAVKAGKFIINDATISCTGPDTSPTTGYSNGVNASGAAIQMESNNGYAGDIEIEISGSSTINSTNGYALYEYLNETGSNPATVTKVTGLSIEGGTFTYGEKGFALFSENLAESDVGKNFITGGTFKDLSFIGYLGTVANVSINRDCTLSVDAAVPVGVALTIESGSTLTIESGSTLTIESGSTLTVNGTLSGNVTGNTVCPVSFESNGGSAVSSTTLSYNGKVTQPPSPTKSGYNFAGWYKESGLINVWDFSTDVVSGGTVLYAKWTVNTYTVTFVSDGSAVAPMTLSYGAPVVAPVNPTKTGYTFAAWSPALPATMPAGNLTVTATWTANHVEETIETDGTNTETIKTTTDPGGTVTVETSITDSATGVTTSASTGSAIKTSIPATASSDDETATVIIDDAAVEAAIKQIKMAAETTGIESAPVIKIAVTTDDTVTGLSVEIPASSLKKLADEGATISVSSGAATITLDSGAASTIGSAGEGDVRIGIGEASKDDLSAAQKDVVGDKMVIRIDATAGDNAVHQLNGKATLSVPYTLKPGEDPNDIVIWYINDNGIIENIAATYADGFVTWETDHFSYYAVAFELGVNPSDDMTLVYIAAVVIVIVAIAIIAVVIRKRSASA